MNVTSLQSISDFGGKLEAQSPYGLVSSASLMPLTNLPISNLSSPQALTGASGVATLSHLTNGNVQASAVSIHGSTNSSNLISSTTSAMLQTLPQHSHLDKKTKERVNYLQQLLKDKKQCQLYPSVFAHVERLLDEGEKCELSKFHHIYWWASLFFFSETF